MGLGSVMQLVKGVGLHGSMGVSHASMQELASPTINVVHLRRPNPLPASELRRMLPHVKGFRKQANVAVRDPEPVVHGLIQGLGCSPATSKSLHQDVCRLVADYSQLMAHAGSGTGPLDLVHTKLEVLGHTPCPKWHADHVAARVLVTYSGPGTWYVPNRHVRRRRSLSAGELTVAVESVDERFAVQVGEGEVLVLKGHAWEGNYGLGCVHRSPLVTEPQRSLVTEAQGSEGSEPAGSDSLSLESQDSSERHGLRLLLTIDDAVGVLEHEHAHGAGCACAT